MQIFLATLYIIFLDVLSRRWLLVFTPLWLSIVYFLYFGMTRGTYDGGILAIGIILSLVFAGFLSCFSVFADRRRS